MKNVIFISGNVPSSKNSKQIFYPKGSKFPRVLWSKQATAYRKESKVYWESYREDFHKLVESLDKPYRIGLHFLRNSKHKYDWVNPTQTILDLMVENEWIEDDNCEIIMPFPSIYRDAYSSYDKRRPGVRIKVNPNRKKEAFSLH